MINLHEFEDKLSLTAKISCEVLSYKVLCGEKAQGKSSLFSCAIAGSRLDKLY